MMERSRIKRNTWLSLLFLLIHCASVCWTFLPNFWSRVLTLAWDSHTHQYITEQAVLNVTIETLSMMPEYQQEQANLDRSFWRAVAEVVNANAAMDFLNTTRSDPVYHFDSERVEEATEMLRVFWKQTLLLTRKKDYQGARNSLGQLLHSLQDFYSHSNWVEMGQSSEYLHLLHPEEPVVPVALEDTPTCAACHRFSCYNNLMEELIRGPPKSLLTTGYFGPYPAKPTGKCSHGGVLDSSRHQGAEGGINKDSTSPLFSPHHYLHKEAANLATTATLGMLQDLRDEVGPEIFLRLFSVNQPPALVFVIDTTGSMFEEITAARFRVLSIIEARCRSHPAGLRSGTFLLVPFHDPDVGPVFETHDPNEFYHLMEDLMALGGGDEPEMCLTAIQMALIHSPPLSEIFVFTDASPKDAHLYSTVKALLLEKQSKLTFLLTEDSVSDLRTSALRKKRMRRKKRETLSPDRFNLYSSLSSISGGMTIFTTNKDIQKASAIVEDSIVSSRVTLFHAESQADSTHSFTVDHNVQNITVHIAGNLIQFVLINPIGVHQCLLSAVGPLATLDQSKGLYRVSLLPPIQPGQWQLSVSAHGPITFNVLGESTLDFLYYFAVEANETHPGLRRVEGSPIAGVPVFLVVAVTGLPSRDNVTITHVTLLDTNGESLQEVLLKSPTSNWSGEELVGHVESVPRTAFSVRLCGKDRRGNKLMRVSTEMVQPTRVEIQVLSSSHLHPGHLTPVVFEVVNHGPARQFTLISEDDCGYLTSSKQQMLYIDERGNMRKEAVIKTPPSVQAGQTVTLTLTVQALDSLDSNYAVVHLTILPEEQDIFPPVCSALRMETSCPARCSLGNWSVSLAVKDRGHSGLASIQLTVGQGELTLTHEGTVEKNENIHMESGRASPLIQVNEEAKEDHLQRLSDRSETHILVNGDPPLKISERDRGRPIILYYTSGCCAPGAELLVLDKAGNVRRCHLMASQQRALREKNSAPNMGANSLLTLALWSLLLMGSMRC